MGNIELGPQDRALRSLLTKGCDILYAEGHNDFNHGQVSARRGASDMFWVRAAARGFDEITEENFLLADMKGRVHAGKGALPPEWPIHAEIYRARPDVGAIVHTHPKASIALSATKGTIRPISHDGAYFSPGVPMFTRTTNTITDSETARLLASDIGDAKGALLKNHGIVTLGATTKEAVIAAILLERAAELELMVLSAPEVDPSPPSDIDAKQRFIFGRVAMQTYWDYFCRRAERASRHHEPQAQPQAALQGALQ